MDEEAERKLFQSDFAHYAARCLRVKTKRGGIAPLTLNEAQSYLHERLEAQRHETGKVRALVLKGRQQGVSTYVEGRFYWRVTHRRGVRAYILTHVDDATNNLFGMAKRYHERCPAKMRPSTAASNAKELVFDRLDSGYKVSTAGSKGAGRSDTLQYFHGSEVAYWPNAESHVAGALQAVPDEPNTEVILESTSAGPQGLFYDLCKAAIAGQSDYILVFIPWFWQAEYRKALPGFEPTGDEREYAEAHGLDDEQLAWRRSKIVELNGEANFRREYPATADEAFLADAEGALWQRENITTHRVVEAPEMVRVVVGVDPAATSKATSDETGIIVAGLGIDQRYYILDDASLRASPDGWGTAAVAAYHRYQADRIVAETNNGGEMVEHVIRTVDKSVPYKGVHASRGKQTRAEPIAALYEQGRVSHVGHHSQLENQMCTWVPGMPSPDRIDSMVWALTELSAPQSTFVYG
jgi:predicted phage terminase large subunit-like protein